jgi:hypothetical protein
MLSKRCIRDSCSQKVMSTTLQQPLRSAVPGPCLLVASCGTCRVERFQSMGPLPSDLRLAYQEHSYHCPCFTRFAVRSTITSHQAFATGVLVKQWQGRPEPPAVAMTRTQMERENEVTGLQSQFGAGGVRDPEHSPHWWCSQQLRTSPGDSAGCRSEAAPPHNFYDQVRLVCVSSGWLRPCLLF